MANVIEVRDDKQVTVGSITFEQAPQHLTAYRTAAGFDLHLPMTVRLKLGNSRDPCPMLSNISAVISGMNDAGNVITVARARHYGWLIGGVPESSASTAAIWTDGLPALAAFERVRDGRPPRFKITVAAELCHLVPASLPGGRRWRTEPFPVHGEAEVGYPTEVWLTMLRHLGVSHPILIEVPLPSSPPRPWDAVWRAVAEATTAIERGGETGWKGCGGAIRLALDEWRKIEEEDMGPGWHQPKREELEARIARQRLDNVRWALRQYAHLAPHTGAEQWSRGDALLMLSALSALLLVRNP